MMRTPRFLYFAGAVFLLVALAVYWALPTVLTSCLNSRLQTIPGYDGGVKKVSLECVRPRLVLHRFQLNKRDKVPTAAFLSADEISFDFSWGQLLRKNFVLNVTAEKPRIVVFLLQRAVGQPRRFGLWQKFFARLPSFRADRVTFKDAILQFKNEQSIPPIDIHFDNVMITATNMANRKEMILPAETVVEGRGLLMNQAPMSVSVKAGTFKKHASFQLKGEVKDFNMMLLNDFLRHYSGLELKSGRLNMGGEFTAKDGGFHGRAHRQIEHLGIRSRHKGLVKSMEEMFLQAWIDWHMENPKGRIENKFQLSGPLGYTDQDVFLAAVWVGKSSFLQSLKAGIPAEIRMGTPEEAQDRWAARQAIEREKLKKGRR